MWKYILACFFVIAVWVVWFFASAGTVEAGQGNPDFSLWSGGYMWVPAAVTALMVVLFVVLYVLRKIRARRAARELEKALAAQAAQHARGASKDDAAEMQAIRQEFEDAVATLKDSRLGRDQNPLYALPWHVIIGPPGAGKSTALRNSGLQFPYRQGAVKGVGGTRNCDWWLTNEAVLLDTAGRWTTEDQDRDEWVTFLDMLKKHRPNRPLDGVIAAVSVTDLASAHEDEIAAIATNIRNRVDEVMERLSMSLPVYVVFTKCDLLPGFVETFNHFSKGERGQLWGATFPVARSVGADAGGLFQERFEKLASDLEVRALGRMQDERRIEDRELIYAFPQQFQTIGRNLSEFVSQLFEPNAFGETPLMRGTYFTSGTQEGRPIDLVMSRMAEAFGIRSELPTGEQQDSKSYFLHDVFSRVIFKDQALAGWSADELKRQKRNEIIAASAIFATALSIITIPCYAYSNNSDFIEESKAEIDAARAILDSNNVDGAADPGVLHLAEIEPLRARTAQLNGYTDDGAPFRMRFGLYEGDALVEPINRIYGEILRRRVLQPIVSGQANALSSFGNTYAAQDQQQPTSDEQQQNYNRLESYLLLTQPKEETEPPPTGAVGERLASRIVALWAAELDVEVDDTMRDKMTANVTTFIQALSSNADLAFERDDTIVDRARGALNRITLADMGLARLEEVAAEQFSSVSLTDLIGNTVPIISSTGTVRPAYTVAAWEGYVRELLESPDDHVVGEPWVLGRERNEDETPQALAANLKSQYFRAYIVEWQEFLRSISVRPPSGNTESLAALQDLTRGTPPVYARLFRAVNMHVNLPEPAPEGEAGLEAAAESAFAAVRRRAQTSVLGRAGSAAVGGALGAGGPDDPDRLLTLADVGAAFEGFTVFGVPPAPPAGQDPPPDPPPTGLDAYATQLATVRDALQTYLDSPADPAPLTEALQTARTSVLSLVETQEVGWRPRFEALLWPPIDGASMSSSQAVATGAGRSWCAEVARPWYGGIHDRYPFNPDGIDVPLADFAAFYTPETGTLWAFYTSALQSSVPRDGSRFEFAQQFGRRGHFNRVLLNYLKSSHAISSAFFPTGATDPTVQLDVRVIPSPEVETIDFSLGGTQVSHRNGPEEWTRVTWPGESPEAGATLEIRGADGMHEEVGQSGDWGLFHLMDAGTVTEGGAGTSVFRVTWRLRTHDVDISVDFRPVRGQTPFFELTGNRSEEALMGPLRANSAVTPRNIVANRRLCNVGG